MKTIILSLVLLALLVTVTPASATPPTPPPVGGVITLNPPTTWPASLDELYSLIDTGSGNWVFANPCPPDTALLYWREVKTMHADDEDALFYRGMLEYAFGGLYSCKPPDDRVAFYGPALPGLLEYVEKP